MIIIIYISSLYKRHDILIYNDIPYQYLKNRFYIIIISVKIKKMVAETFHI